MQGMLGSGPQSMAWKDTGFLMGCPPLRGVGTGGRARDGKGSLIETCRTPVTRMVRVGAPKLPVWQ